MTSHGALGNHVSENASRFSDWVDGLNMLLGTAGVGGGGGGGSGSGVGKETEGFVEALTEIGLKIKLLGKSSHASLNSGFCKKRTLLPS